jgi:MutS domain V
MTFPQTFYDDKIKGYSTLIGAVQKRIALISLFRLGLFTALAISVYFLLKDFSYPLLVLSILVAGSFIALVGLSLRLKDRRALLEKLLFINTNESGLLKNELNGFPDGQAFLTQEGYLDDLDIFGKRSLFHALNRTTTSHGMERLAGLLRQSLQDGGEIGRHQEAIRALTPQVDERQLLTAHGLLNKESEGNLYSLADWLQTPPRLMQQNWLRVTQWVIMLYNTGALLLLVATGNYRPLVAGVLAGWIVSGVFSKYIGQQHLLLGKKQAVLDQYAAILKVFNAVDASNSELLVRLKAQTSKAHLAIRKLARLSSYFDQRLNAVVNFIFNNLFLYNLHCMVALEKWKEANKNAFPEWIEAVSNIECLNSLAAFAFNNPEYVYPVVAQGGSLAVGHAAASLSITTEGMAHPLIPAGERVTNSFTIGRNDKLILVTGSNMSGKTTFLRTLGINLLLAQCGAPVCAASFSFTPMHILTSLRVSDSLQEHTSYFMAELKKLQKIIHNLQTGRPALVLIDEILRGTNSEDKTYGSEQFILKLLQYHCLSLFATHDLSLGQLENARPGVISNYCFESVIESGELHFNYRLQRGIARNRNASFLMEKMEII